MIFLGVSLSVNYQGQLLYQSRNEDNTFACCDELFFCCKDVKAYENVWNFDCGMRIMKLI